MLDEDDDVDRARRLIEEASELAHRALVRQANR